MTNSSRTSAALIASAALTLASCAAQEQPASPQDDFFASLSTHCGKAYAGRLVSEDAVDADFADGQMVMHVRECSDDRIAIPFHVGLTGEDGAVEWDRSRTWVIDRLRVEAPDGSIITMLQLKHDHRHEDGEADPVTMYGGVTADLGTARAQDFPVDRYSIDMFEREGLTASVTNVWTLEVDPAGSDPAIFAYQLRRTVEGGAPEDRLFRVEFDLGDEVDAPPAPWGWE